MSQTMLHEGSHLVQAIPHGMALYAQARRRSGQVWAHLHACFHWQGLCCQCFKAAIPDHLSIEAAISCIIDLQARDQGVSSMAVK